MSKLLINESPLVVLPSLAVAVGVDKALVLQQIQYWLNAPGSGKDIDGEAWIWNTYSQWATQFPFWNERKIMKIMTQLKKDGLVKVRQFNKAKYDHTNFYTIDALAINNIIKADDTQFGSITNTQFGSITNTQERSIYKGTKTTSQTTSETEFLSFWETYGKIGNKRSALKAWMKLSVKDRKLAKDKFAEFKAGLPAFQRDSFSLHASTYLNNKRWEDEPMNNQPALNSGWGVL